MKSFYLLSFITFCFFNYSNLMADDTIRAMIGTQTFLCELTNQLSCKAVNQVQQKEIQLKKAGAKIQIEDKSRNLSAEIDTSVDGVNMVYDLSLCSAQTCSMSSIVTNSSGSINQTMSGQYNITQKSFYILAVFINTNLSPINLEEKIITPKLSKYLEQ